LSEAGPGALLGSRYVRVTGFGPFGEVRCNASGILAERLDGAVVAGMPVRALVLATAYREARERIAGLAREPGCVALLALGVWRGAGVKLERRARGLVTSEKRDVSGEVWAGRMLGADRMTALPLEAWSVEGATLSDDCGGYVCNATYHALLEASEGRRPWPLFAHVPRDVGARGIAASERVVRHALARLIDHIDVDDERGAR
jgi:pyrrolidone-carboxylate peptidase